MLALHSGPLSRHSVGSSGPSGGRCFVGHAQQSGAVVLPSEPNTRETYGHFRGAGAACQFCGSTICVFSN